MRKTLTQTLSLPTQMVAAYFEQTENYFSETAGAFILVKDMHPNYAANALTRYLKESGHWALDAGVDTAQANSWMVRRPLLLTLLARANA